MAKISAHGTEIARYESANGTTRYCVMSDGVVLRQFKIVGKWESPTIIFRHVTLEKAHVFFTLRQYVKVP